MTEYKNIPAELVSLRQWVCANEYSKAPMRAFEYAPASSTKPETWSHFPAAVCAVEQGYYDYCGFVFHDNGYVGIDIDDGFDENGEVSALAMDIITTCKSYTELSRSGRGFHIIVKGDLPFKGKNNLRGVEIYKDARYFIMTGNVFIYSDIRENQRAIDYVLDQYFQCDREQKTPMLGTERIYSPKWEWHGSKRIPVRPIYPPIPAGSRNICLTSLAGLLRAQGYSKIDIYNELLYANNVACEPKLHQSEIQSICNSIMKYKR